ncbi:hypothetical protein D5086_001921 [Populus alba]|uniref:Uncharacterized protein n=2 Tax=Populus alba TaxID=43335 RepID=A0ACC4D044_POPAL|nr:histone H2B.2-like [Populus alba]TKR75136.1 hypothetical protein D5086_0000288410 [Populus alba]
MAPKRRGKEVVGTVLRSTKKVVKETVQVAAIENDNQESTQDQDQNGEPEDIDTPALETFRTIPVDEKVHEEEDRVIEVSVEKPDKEAAIADSQEHIRGPSKEEERQEDQTREVSLRRALKVLIKGDISSGAASRGQQEEPSREDEIRKEDQTGGVSVEEPSKEDPKEDAASAGDQGKKLGPKKVHPDLGVSSMAMSMINSLMNDMFERIAEEAAKFSDVYRKRTTLSSGEIQGAVKLVLPGELGKHAIAEGSEAGTNYISHGTKRSKSWRALS